MSSPSRDRDRERLEHQLRTDEYHRLLRRLQQKEPFLRQFRTWGDVIAFMRNGTSRDPRKDEILRPIFKAHAEDKDPRWRAVLIVIFWPGLESIDFQKRNWDADQNERWQNVVWTFLKVLSRIDVRRRPDRLVQKVFNDTVHHLHDEYRRAWNRTNHELTTDPEKIDALVAGVEGLGFADIERREAKEAVIVYLREHLDAGRITEASFLQLVGTRVYNKSLADYARQAGLNYEVAKKRRQRAEAAIRRFERENPDSSDRMSPSRSRLPL